MRVARRFSAFLLALAFAPIGQAGAAPSPPTLPQAIAAIVNRPNLVHTLFGVEVYDLDSKRVVFDMNGQKFFKPASTTKVLTEGTTLALLGPDFTFTTPVYRTGAVDSEGTLNGDLVLVASGDPNLSQRIQPDGTLAFENEDHSYDGSKYTAAVPGDPLAVLRDLAKQIAAHGIKKITGRVLVDATLFPEAGPESGTGAYISPIVVNDNLIDIVVTPGKSAGQPATIAVSPETPYATFTSKATTGAAKSDNTLDMEDVIDGAGNHTVTVTGSVPLSDPPILYAYRVPTPSRYAEVGLTYALQQTGVAISAAPSDTPFVKATYAPTYMQGNLVAAHVSPPLREDVKITLKVSDNLHASVMPYLWGVYVAHADAAKLQAGFAQEHKLLSGAGLDLSSATQSDGLGGDAYFTPDFIVHYLAWVRTQKWYPDFYRGLPILGVDGTLFDIATNLPAKGKVHAKTGTWGGGDLLNSGGMTSAKGLAGYVTSRNGHRLVFCIYLNRLTSRRGEDGSKTAGQINGEIANAIYLYAR
jgi:D-alanyl-D-alanine carboxypeptidase/D-alanyl-D-alanine-endopeptidase (penicillin-binding protein 4)